MTNRTKLLSLFLTVLFVTSTFSSAVVAGGLPGNAVGNHPTGGSVGNQQTDSGSAEETVIQQSQRLPNGAPPLAKKAKAVQIIEGINASERGGNANHVERARERLNGTLTQYNDPVRVNRSHVFTNDGIAIRALMHLYDSKHSNQTHRATALIYQADNRSAHVAVADASRVLNRYEGQLSRGTLQSARSQLRVSRRALQRAERWGTRDAEGQAYYKNRAAAIPHLRTAHRHAQKVLEFVARDVNPRVTLDNRFDPRHSDNATLRYQLRGNVSVISPSAGRQVEVTVNGEQRATVNTTVREGDYGANRTFVTTVNLTEHVNKIEVAVVDGEETATLWLDGDGLSDVYEANVSRTSSLDPDSDAVTTNATEADNGVSDGREDFDDDGLRTLTERERGLDPHASDTDNDGLDDRSEITLTQTDPLKSDSDDDGTSDAAEDPDEDGLDNLDEVGAKTDPQYADSDIDNLTDRKEVEDYGTNATDSDTDHDLLLDGEEVTLGTDPLVPDSDKDGILDGNETYTTTTSNESLGVSVAVEGQGNVANQVTVKTDQRRHLNGGHISEAGVSPVTSLKSEESFENATLAFDYNESAVPSDEEENLSVFWYNESLGTFTPVKSTVDPGNNTVRATVSHFSTYVVFHERTWLEPFQQDPPTADESTDRTVRNATVLNDTFDDGQLNGWNTSVTGDASISITDQQLQMRVYKCSRATVSRSLGSVEGTLTVSFEWGHAADDYWEVADWGLRNAETGEPIPYTVVAGKDVDNINNPGASQTGSLVARADVDGNVPIEFTLRPSRFCSNGDHGNTYFTVDDIQVNETRTVTVSDSDGDGIPDYHERAGLLLGNGSYISTDPTDEDTDGDGLNDSREFQYNNTDTYHATGRPFYDVLSYPTTPNSDADNLTDNTEVRGWDIPVVTSPDARKPLRFEKDCRWRGTALGNIYWQGSSCTQDDTVLNVSSDPLAVDSDGDGLMDDIERNETYTDPEADVTYAITDRHQQFVENLDGEVDIARKVGIIDQRELLQNVRLTDASDDFDIVLTNASSERKKILFTALDGEVRSDIWYTNYDEYRNETDPWDPDTDNDGLTDGQELVGLTKFERGWLDSSSGVEQQLGTNATDPDHDGDGYWDGWIGVYGVGRSENVVLYREHLWNENQSQSRGVFDNSQPTGVRGDEIVTEQIGVHKVSNDPMKASKTSATLVGRNGQFHSNVHIGELQWGTKPTDRVSQPDTNMTIEVDYLSGRNPFRMNLSTGEDILDATRRNYLLYGINLTFVESDELTNVELRSTCRSKRGFFESGEECIEPSTFNVWETNLVEDRFHNDTSTLHLFWTNRYGNDSPAYYPHDAFIPSGVRGMEGHTGSREQVRWIENGFGTPHGAIMFDKEFDSNATRHRVLMEEIGHGFGAGTADDEQLRIGECYSGLECPYGIDGNGVSQAGDPEPTPEYVSKYSNPDWPIMGSAIYIDGNRTAFSIEEVTTMDFEDIPSVDD